MRLPDEQLETLCRYVVQHGQQLRAADRKDLERAFTAWAYEPGLALLPRPRTGGR